MRGSLALTRQVPPALDSSTSSVSGNSSTVQIYHKPFSFIALSWITKEFNQYFNLMQFILNLAKQFRKWFLPWFFLKYELSPTLLLSHLDFETECFIKELSSQIERYHIFGDGIEFRDQY